MESLLKFSTEVTASLVLMSGFSVESEFTFNDDDEKLETVVDVLVIITERIVVENEPQTDIWQWSIMFFYV